MSAVDELRNIYLNLWIAMTALLSAPPRNSAQHLGEHHPVPGIDIGSISEENASGAWCLVASYSGGTDNKY